MSLLISKIKRKIFKNLEIAKHTEKSWGKDKLGKKSYTEAKESSSQEHLLREEVLQSIPKIYEFTKTKKVKMRELRH